MRAGKLNKRITIQSKAASKDTYGEETITWSTWATVWAAVEPLRGREFLDGKMITAEISHRFRIRARDGILEEWRVSYDSRVFDILAIIHIEERDREIHLMCQEIR